MTTATDKEIAALQAFEDAYNRHWKWPAGGPIDPEHPIQRATLAAIRAAYPHLLGVAYAQGTEAQRAETATEIGGSVHEGPVAEGDAPKGAA